MKQSGAQILLQSLEKKNGILDEMILQNKAQEKLLKQENLDMDAFDKAIDRQRAYVEELDKLDDVFYAVYYRVRDELMHN